MPQGQGTDDLQAFDDAESLRPSKRPTMIPAAPLLSADMVDDDAWDTAAPTEAETQDPIAAAAQVTAEAQVTAAAQVTAEAQVSPSFSTPPSPSSHPYAPVAQVIVAAAPAPELPAPADSAPQLPIAAKWEQIPAPPLVPSSPLSSMAPAFDMAGTVPPLDLFAATQGGHKRMFRFGPMLAAGGALIGGVVLGFAGRGALGSASSGAKTASLSVSSKQPGIKLMVDGKDMGNLPRQVTGLAAGEHVISLEGDHYRARRSSITLRADEVRELEPVTLEVARGAASFEVKPAGATLALVSSDERREIRDWSRAVDVDNAQKWTLEASKAGYQTQRFAVQFGDEFAKTFVVALSPEGGSPSSALSSAPSLPSMAPSKAETARGKEPRASEAAPSAEAPNDDAPKSAATGSCTLNANSIPHSKVLVDGRPVGLTPKVGITVPAGQHTVLFVGDNSQKTTTVTCSSGEKKTVSVRL